MNQKHLGFYDRMITAIPGGERLQDWLIGVGRRKSAMAWLQSLAAAESVFFPIPVDPLLGLVVLARETRYIRIALLTACSSVAGAAIGWLMAFHAGHFLIETGWLDPEGRYADVVRLFEKHGAVVIFIGALTPFPYKLVTLGAGFLGTSPAALIPFVLISLAGRSLRYGLLAAIIRYRRDTSTAALLTLVLAGLFTFFWWHLK